MSIALMTLAWKSTVLSSGQKFVLISLCDNANDQGECYPAIGTVAMRCSMGERTVQGHISDLEAMGILRREMRNGRSTVYHINSSRFDNPLTPADFAPPQNPHPTPAGGAPPPPQNPHPTPAGVAPRTVKEPKRKPPGKRPKAIAARLPTEWKLPKKWGEATLAKYPGYTVEYIREQGEAFHDYWTSVPDDRHSRKTDWEKAWRNWMRNARGPQQGARGGAGWWTSDESKMAKAAELGLPPPQPGESMQQFEARIRAAIDNGGKPPVQRMSRVGVAPEAQPAGKSTKPPGLDLRSLVGKTGATPRKTDLSTKEETEKEPQA